MRKTITHTAIGLFFAVLIGLLAWPVVSNFITRKNIKASIEGWNRQVEACGPETVRIHRNLAGWYNLNLTGERPEEGFERTYGTIMDYGDIMGILEIPTLGTTLPIYHGVSDSILEKGVGHLPETCFPLGEEGNHPVLVGKMELPGKRLFTEVSAVKEGDYFLIQIPGQILVYQVEAAYRVPPEEVNGLGPVNGEDLCTVVAVSPRGGDNGCLLIQGRRTEEWIPAAETKALTEQGGRLIFGIVGVLLAGAVPILAGILVNRKKRGLEPAEIG